MRLFNIQAAFVKLFFLLFPSLHIKRLVSVPQSHGFRTGDTVELRQARQNYPLLTIRDLLVDSVWMVLKK